MRFDRTLTAPIRDARPEPRAALHKFSVDDDEGTRCTFTRDREVTTLTTRRGRLLAWIGTIRTGSTLRAARAQPLGMGSGLDVCGGMLRLAVGLVPA